MQLVLFLKLVAFAERVIFVGDVAACYIHFAVTGGLAEVKLFHAA